MDARCSAWPVLRMLPVHTSVQEAIYFHPPDTCVLLYGDAHGCAEILTAFCALLLQPASSEQQQEQQPSWEQQQQEQQQQQQQQQDHKSWDKGSSGGNR